MEMQHKSKIKQKEWDLEFLILKSGPLFLRFITYIQQKKIVIN